MWARRGLYDIAPEDVTLFGGARFYKLTGENPELYILATVLHLFTAFPLNMSDARTKLRAINGFDLAAALTAFADPVGVCWYHGVITLCNFLTMRQLDPTDFTDAAGVMDHIMSHYLKLTDVSFSRVLMDNEGNGRLQFMRCFMAAACTHCRPSTPWAAIVNSSKQKVLKAFNELDIRVFKAINGHTDRSSINALFRNVLQCKHEVTFDPAQDIQAAHLPPAEFARQWARGHGTINFDRLYLKECAGCGGVAMRLPRCGGCLLVNYCSSECSKERWRAHKPACQEARRR